MLKVLSFGLAKDQYVIEINDNKLAKISLEYLIHQSHEGAWCVGKAKRHNQPLIQPHLGFECRFPLITLPDPYLIVPTPKINLREILGSMKLIKHVFQPWYGMPVLNCDLVDGAAIHSHPHGPILLWHKKSGDGTRTQTLPNKTFGYEFLHLSLNFQGVLGVHSIGRFVGQDGPGNEVNMVLDGSWGGRPDGISSGKTCDYCWRSCVARGCRGVSAWSFCGGFKRIIPLRALNS